MGILVNEPADWFKSNISSEHVVIWSGGCDSTLLLKEIAERHGTKVDPVVAISIKHYLIDDNKNKQEELHREKIKKELSDMGLHIIYHTIDVGGSTHYNWSTNSIQGYMWVTNIVSYLPINCTVYMGYIKDDSIVPQVDKLTTLFDACTAYQGKKCKLSTPYLHLTKVNIIMEIFKSELYDHVWFCEVPTDKGQQCTKCNPCRTHIDALKILASRGYIEPYNCLPEDEKKIFNKRLIKKELKPNGKK